MKFRLSTYVLILKTGNVSRPHIEGSAVLHTSCADHQTSHIGNVLGVLGVTTVAFLASKEAGDITKRSAIPSLFTF